MDLLTGVAEPEGAPSTSAAGEVPLVVITDSDLPSQGAEERLLQEAGLCVRREACRTEDDVIARCADATALIVQWAPITARVLDTLPAIRFISRLGIGVDMIDLAAATRRGVAVANTPDYCVEEVACHTLALILDRARGIVELDRSVEAGRWQPVQAFPEPMRPSLVTVGVIGYGRIGRRVAGALRAIGFRVVVHDPMVAGDAITAAGHEPLELNQVLAEAHVVTLHAPLTEATRHMIDAAAIGRMRPGAYLVNTCRGGLVDEPALTAAIRDRRLAGAGLDVFEREPLPLESELRDLAGVTLTPHAAWYSPAALADLPVDATRQTIAYLAGEDVPSIVNPGYRDAPPDAG
jgi:D-3-phosphoglycerate dehydrogenase / 2-oxoglutarate reductase